MVFKTFMFQEFGDKEHHGSVREGVEPCARNWEANA